ncbi:S41 family peptidase [Mucilaginibacter ginsenosidivorax]|uniref:Peptidase S41 n=1 Tax=Mucilaginibacter ginsenosidivorax TaxID=862126 RepID=A0A5B8VYS5_9SPHI|nr:S41 family peptidase [Mucilaginibacter ginsenosidivorax]QEC76503.1 peptidase S41 [Mucilaginibacter ginsenosidivorax]
MKKKPSFFCFTAAFLLVTGLMLCCPFASPAQDCNCATNFEWMVTTFEKNDAGFQYVVDKKGMDDYQKHNAAFREKVKNITKVVDCQAALYNWLRYFRPGHIGISVPNQPQSANNTKFNADSVRQLYKNTKVVNLTEAQFISVLAKKKNKNPIEGIWTDGRYVIGIIGDSKDAMKYTGFIIKADSIFWMPKQIKVDMILNANKKGFTASYYMQNHSTQPTQANLVAGTNNLLILYNTYWTRLHPENSPTKKESIVTSFSRSQVPFIEKLSDKTVYIRIPSFRADQKRIIDSSLLKYDAMIKSVPNLIIDIRNGTGGSDASYEKIIPYLYTSPIREVGVQLLATELNAAAHEKYAKQYDDTANRNYCLRVAKKMREHPGAFITMSDRIADNDTLKEVLPYPQKVAVICNQNNGSTDEQFLLAAKQSAKVKVFGRPTFGELDISNMNYIDFPDKKFQLGYCMSKSFRIPGFMIDGVGIQPDYFIDESISETDWIDYTQSVIEN